MFEKIIQASIRHRLVVVLFTIGLGLLGGYSLSKLPIDAVPDITNNQVQINTLYPAFSPTEVEKQLTFPIETSLAGIPGLDYTRSLSRNGFSQVTAVFADDVDIYFARQQVGERLSEAKESLPSGAEPRMGAISTGLGEVLMWVVEYVEGSELPYRTPEGRSLNSAFEKAAYLREVQDWIIRPQLKNLPGVAGIDSIGGYNKHFVVEPDPERMIAYRLTFSDIIESLEKNNVSTGAGYIEHRGEAYIVRAASLLASESEIAQIVVGESRGTPVTLDKVAHVGVGKELRSGSASENGKEVVVGTALMLIGANSRTVAMSAERKLSELNSTLPPGIRAKVVLNRTQLVDATIETVERNLFEGALLVVVVLFALLGNLRAALITALAIPFSMLMTASGMLKAGISGNLMSLGAIDFGLIVDGAVIIVENCIRRLAEAQERAHGKPLSLEVRLQEVFQATKEMIKPSAYGQAIIITVYVPILFLSGIEGKMFHPMAMSVIFALLSAFVLSLTFVPAMVAICLGGNVSEGELRVMKFLRLAYRNCLQSVLRHRIVINVLALALFLGSLLLFGRLGQEFVPTLDEKDIAMHAMRIPSTGLTQSTEMQFEVEKAVSAMPEVQIVFSKTGTAEMASDPMPPNVSDTFIKLKPQSEWPNPSESKAEFVERLEDVVAKVPGNNYEFTQPIQMRFNELIAGVRSDVAIKVFGDDFEKLIPVAENIGKVLRGIDGAADVKVEQSEGLPVLSIDIRREAAARLGLSVQEIQDIIAMAIGGREAGFVFEGDRRFDLVVRLPERLRQDPEQIRELPIPVPHARGETEDESEESSFRSSSVSLVPRRHGPDFVPLRAIADITLSEGPNQISRENGKRRVVVQANIRGRDIGSFVTDAQAAIEKEVVIPPGYWLSWGGQFENLVAAKARLMLVVPVCFILIFLLLLGALHSGRQALMVFSGVPLALTGGIFALWLRDMPFSISAAVGFIALSGVAVLNGLVMISCINQLRDEGEDLDQAIIHGASLRLRPVLMTALVASLGFLPMALAHGTGAEVQKPIATVVIGGLISATLLTLFVLPALYKLSHSVQRKS